MRIVRGFTLLEVLVALAVFAMVALASGRFTQVQLQSWSLMEQRGLAEIVANNVMEQARAPHITPSFGEQVSQQVISGLPLTVVTRIEKTELAHYFNVNVEVFLGEQARATGPRLYQLRSAKYDSYAY